MEEEIWKPVVVTGYEGLYEVSNKGNVRALYHRGNGISYKPRNLKPEIIKSGYNRVKFSAGKAKNYLVHRLVAMAFIENQNDYKYVNHKNGIKTDNRVNNLEWVTSSENRIHAFENGLSVSKKGSEMYNSKLTDDQVRHIKRREMKPTEYAKLYNVNRKTIYAIVDGSTWKHVN